MSELEEKYFGLTEQEVLRNRKNFGRNEFAQKEKTSFLKTAVKFFAEPVYLLLIGASLIYFLLGEARDGTIMLAFIIFMGGIEMYQEWRTDKTLDALKDLSSPRVTVIRGGQRIAVASEELVPDDIMLLEEGERISADGAVLFSDGLGVDESTLTGEADIVWKTPEPSEKEGRQWRLNVCYSGTNVVAGRGVVRVTATGLETEYGKIGVDVADAPDRPTPLEKQTRRLVRNCSFFSLTMMLLVILATLRNHGGFIDAALSGITLAMATIPEEFPVVLTVFLAMGAWRLARRNALIRRIPSVETLGAVTVLCVDKTGTLTQNRMSLRELTPFGKGTKEELLRISVLASETNPYDPMEVALIKKAMDCGINTHALQSNKLLHEYPFSSEARMMGHVWEINGTPTLAAKGSPENIFALCGLSESEKELADKEQKRLSDSGCRVLAVASAELRDAPEKMTDCRLRLIGLAAFIDPPRETVPAS
ncbi:MAG: HAD-IC family P-type ATPase, partial [Synergistaceae bacterium]|nr:HAD-IC family P-type ATPase [Synergistaceae bacterium]